jgi:hypothetical protein
MMNEKQRKQKKRVAVLLAVGLGVELLFLGYMGYTLWDKISDQTTMTMPSHTPTRVPVELWDAYEKAYAAARTRAEDVQLVSASTQWQAVSEQTLLDGTGNWSFVFYSPMSSESLDVVANAQQAQVVNQTQVWVAPNPLANGLWQAGPREALLVFLAYGGRIFRAEHPQAMVDLHLADSDEGGAVWTVVTLDPEDRSLFSSLIDAETNQVLAD